jgi:hypothetical protein
MQVMIALKYIRVYESYGTRSMNRIGRAFQWHCFDWLWRVNLSIFESEKKMTTERLAD